MGQAGGNTNMTFAIIKTGGKQYKVSAGNKLAIEKLTQTVGEEFDFDQVLMVGNAADNTAKIGMPLIEGAKVHAKVLAQGKAEKKVVFKYHNKTRYRKKKGHRQPETTVEILKILA